MTSNFAVKFDAAGCHSLTRFFTFFDSNKWHMQLLKLFVFLLLQANIIIENVQTSCGRGS